MICTGHAGSVAGRLPDAAVRDHPRQEDVMTGLQDKVALVAGGSAARTRLNVTEAQCEALFASGLQRSDLPDAGMVAEVISHAVQRLGTRGCIGRMAQEFGDHPEMAADRMRWVRQLVFEVSAPGYALGDFRLTA
jgi:hypothetical protein